MKCKCRVVRWQSKGFSFPNIILKAIFFSVKTWSWRDVRSAELQNVILDYTRKAKFEVDSFPSISSYNLKQKKSVYTLEISSCSSGPFKNLCVSVPFISFITVWGRKSGPMLTRSTYVTYTTVTLHIWSQPYFRTRYNYNYPFKILTIYLFTIALVSCCSKRKFNTQMSWMRVIPASYL